MAVHSVMRFALGVSLSVVGLACASTEASPTPGARTPTSVSAATAASAPAQAAEAAAAIADLAPTVRYVVRLGDMRNGSGVGREDLGRVLHDAARVRAGGLKDAAVIDANPRLAKQAADRHLPVITLDGLVTQVTESPSAGGLQVRASVEFSLRRDQVLRATVSGAATAAASSPAISDTGRRQLQEEAIDGAVQSALLAAARGFTVATR
ncbi:MAG TPA: hypothetical protein VGM06_05095 [Polyangiaceae bacterium]|jgi:hypothetical protein